ncbi:hypothetical protein AC578_1149 [Pseudocercospora eumusae]|uniref:Uncharacterized protein n=1 Tax=Pseudocercospora eumusae TaxID=321146 RepID=A0A139HJR4_9PEZI|nr:hypothetical protein AC578_1149 [Pseudocercospora eumusae]
MRRRQSGPVGVIQTRKRGGRARCKTEGTVHVDAAVVEVFTELTMDARIDRDAHLKELRSQSRVPKQTWYEWFWGIKKAVPARATDAATSEAVRRCFTQMLDHVEPPHTFKPSEVALQLTDKELAGLGYEKWEEALPGVYELAFELRDMGDCEILRKGVVIGDDVTLADIDGPIRIRRVVM